MKTIEEVLAEVRPELDFSKADDFVSDGMLDSLDMITLVSELDRIHGISIRGTDIVPDNFRSVESIKKLLVRYGVQY